MENVDSTPEEGSADVSNDALDNVIEQSMGDYQELPPEEMGPVRDENGRFVSSKPNDQQGEAPEDDPASADAETESEEVAIDDDAEDSTPDEEPALEAPEHWSSDDKERFAKAPKEIQEWMIERSKAADRVVTEKTEALANERKQLEPVKGVLSQWQGYFEALGQQPHEAVSGLIRADYVLRTGSPEQKSQAMQALVRSYGIPMDGQSVEQDGNSEVAALRQQVTNLQQQLGTFQTQHEQTAEQQTVAAVTEFREAKDSEGNPLHPHFEAVKKRMAELLSRGAAETLSDAYKAAVRLDDTLYEQTLESERERVRSEAERKRKEAAEKARRVARRPGGTAPGGQPAGGDLDALIGSALDGHFT